MVMRAAAEGGESPAETIVLKVLTPEGVVAKQVVQEVSLPGIEGRLGVLRGHAPMLAPVGVGVLRFKHNNEWEPMVLFGGYASVENNVVTILASECEAGDNIPSMEESQKQLDQATSAMATAESKTARLNAKDALKRAAARIQAATMLTGRKRS